MCVDVALLPTWHLGATSSVAKLRFCQTTPKSPLLNYCFVPRVQIHFDLFHFQSKDIMPGGAQNPFFFKFAIRAIHELACASECRNPKTQVLVWRQRSETSSLQPYLGATSLARGLSGSSRKLQLDVWGAASVSSWRMCSLVAVNYARRTTNSW